VEQLSLPYRIALVGILAVGVLYLLVLRPKDDAGTTAAVPAATATTASTTATSGTTAPGVKGLSTAVDKAKGAAAAQSGSDDATQAATGGTGTGAAPSAAAKPGATAASTTTTPAVTPATGTATAAKPAVKPAATKPAKPAGPAGDPSKPILAELDRGHTAVVLFVGKTAKDDSAVRRAVKAIDRHHGKVDVHVLPLSRVGRYEAITRGVTVHQSPTVLVISKQRAARAIVGFTTVAELDQLVNDVRRGY
jgi:hypothetical protein